MFEQLTLNEETTVDIPKIIGGIFRTVSDELKYDPNYFTIEPNYKNKGKETEKIIGYSLLLDNSLFAKANPNFTSITVKKALLPSEIKGLTEMTLNFENLDFGIEYIKFAVRKYAEVYIPSNRFGCCHLYEKCSDEKKCIANDKFHAKGCFYRENLESGRIFYGKNANQ